MRVMAKQRKAIEKAYAPKEVEEVKFVTNFAPNGRSGLFIYAVSVKHHPEKVKIGMTRNWKSRRRAYETWNLTTDAILEEQVFCITEEFIDLAKLENHILNSVPFELAFGREWFFGTVEEAARIIDRIMCEHSITYDYA